MKKTEVKFTLTNFIKYWAKRKILLTALPLLTLIAGAAYVLTIRDEYTASSRIMFVAPYESTDSKSTVSPYVNIPSMLTSQLAKHYINPSSETKLSLTILEVSRGVFDLQATSQDSDLLISAITSYTDNAANIINDILDTDTYTSITLDAPSSYQVSSTTFDKVLKILLAWFAGVAIATVIIFIRFDNLTKNE